MTTLEIETAIATLKNGGVVIFPTETVFGIGASVNSPVGIKRVYDIKDRDPNKPTHLLVSNLAMAEKYGQLSEADLALAHKFWPGPLTLIVSPQQIIADQPYISIDKKVGLRMPGDPELLQIIEKVGCPILGPSANKSGKIPPINPDEIDKELLSLVDYTINQNSAGQKPSTIIDLTRYNASGKIDLLREGPISLDQITEVLKETK